jgi:hypothetical protein
VIDVSAEMLTINEARLGAAAERVSYQVAELFVISVRGRFGRLALSVRPVLTALPQVKHRSCG